MALFLLAIAAGCVWALLQPITAPRASGAGSWQQQRASKRAAEEFQRTPRWYAFKHRATLVLGILLCLAGASWCVMLAFTD